MATLADLRTRIISETVRDDLLDDMAADLDRVIAGAIDAYSNEAWWFNEITVTGACVAGADHAALPIGLHSLIDLWAVIGGIRYRLRVRQPGEIIGLYSVPSSGQPTDYALDAGGVFFWPKPNQAYPLIFEIIADVTPPLLFSDGTSSNIWTNAGQDLICAEAKVRLYRDYLSATLQDPRVVSANNQREDAYSNLRAESNRRMATGRVRAGW